MSKADILDKGSKFFRCGLHLFLVKESSNFRNFWCVDSDKGVGVSQCGNFANREGGRFFAILYGRLLWTAP